MYRDLWRKIPAKDRLLSLFLSLSFLFLCHSFSLLQSISLYVSPFLYVSPIISLYVPLSLWISLHPSLLCSLAVNLSLPLSPNLHLLAHPSSSLTRFICLFISLSLPFLCLSVWSMHLCPSGSMSDCLSISLLSLGSRFVYLSVCVCLTVPISDYLSLSPAICLYSGRLTLCPSVGLSLPECLFVSLPVCLSL